MIEKVMDTKSVENLFDGWEETLIWSCLQGIMGEIYGDDPEKPVSAMAVLGDFIFFAGEPNRELVLYKPDWCKNDFMILVPQNPGWEELIKQCYGEKARKTSRYAIKKEPDVFCREKLLGVVETLPEDYTLRRIDEALYHLIQSSGGFKQEKDAGQCSENEWCRDLVSQFSDYETYEKMGLGVVILKGDEIVSGASSYSRYRDGIEIEIDTKEPYRRQGLAYICGAKLILECLDRDLYPSWDAQNLWSVALAKKLGYHYSHAYTAYEIWGY